MGNIVAIVGRPNVGKSTLFNRLVEARIAIMDDQPGVTRDRHYGKVEWRDYQFTVVDTGGYVYGSEDVFESAIREQVEIAIREATVILFVVDAQQGVHPLDKDFAEVLRKSQKPVLLVANKADTAQELLASHEFYSLNIGDGVYPIAAISGSGTGELLDQLIKYLKKDFQEDSFPLPRLAIIGKPNVGKSSFVNALLNQNRSIVTDIAGTTRDAIDSLYNYYGKKFILTDTAGLRRKSKIKENIEFYSVLRTIRAIENSDVCIVLIDATQGLESQDMGIIHLALSNKKGVVIMVNKWDLVPNKTSNTAQQIENQIREKLGIYNYLPIVFSSVVEKQRIMKVIEKAIEVYENKNLKIPTSKLNDILLPEIERYPPPTYRGHYIRIKYCTQLSTKTPAFAFFCNHPKHVNETYTRFLENKIRQHFGFLGVPISIFYRQK
ncbi:MAG: ribosome biogenesis GTPase Der [Cytophagales bacterium]|nr:ribosome biogenesis GTPase Der [Cytophagales bacterium]MDW8383390.1 ribosome biogenesis GTPase Der [Flammeovirgaceae bacterium]